MKRKICIVTGTRADYGLLRKIMLGVRASPRLELQIVATGAHLSPEFGLTYREIEADGLRIDRRVEMLLGCDSPAAITKSMGLGLIGIADALKELRPDVVLLLGDRYEILAAASAALLAGIPIAHVHGGELTEGAFDDSIRHAITKMSHLHFVAAAAYWDRVIQLGEQPASVHLVGGLGVDNLLDLQLLDRAELGKSLGFELRDRNLLVTFHPVTLSGGSSAAQMDELLDALDAFPDHGILFTMPNADPDSRELAKRVEAFAARRVNVRVFVSMGYQRYLSCMKVADAVVGNSSSGLTEAPAFRVPTVNIGERQDGRLKASSVIDCPARRADISAAIARALSAEFRSSLRDVRNPYGEGGASGRIVKVLEEWSVPDGGRKKFHDLVARGS